MSATLCCEEEKAVVIIYGDDFLEKVVVLQASDSLSSPTQTLDREGISTDALDVTLLAVHNEASFVGDDVLFCKLHGIPCNGQMRTFETFEIQNILPLS
jgi:hypothetical protein